MNDHSSRDPRVPLALERTFLAWIRTALAMMGFGFVVARFGLFLREIALAKGVLPPHNHGFSSIVGTALVALGAAVAAYAGVRFRRGLASYERDESPVARSAATPTAIAIVLCAIGVSVIWYFVTTS